MFDHDHDHRQSEARGLDQLEQNALSVAHEVLEEDTMKDCISSDRLTVG